MGRRDVAFWQHLARRVGRPVLELGCGTGRLAVPVGARGLGLRRDRSFGADARARAPARAPGAPRRPGAPGARRHPPPAVPAPVGVRPGDGALRHAPEPAARGRPAQDARGRGRGAPAGGGLRRGSRRRPPELAGIPPGDAPDGMASGQEGARHPHRVGPAGPRRGADHLRAGVRGAARPAPGRPAASISRSAP